jgi:hypothetical protein
MTLIKSLSKNTTSTINSGIIAIQPLESSSDSLLKTDTKLLVTTKKISIITTQNLSTIIENIVDVCPIQQDVKLSNKIWLKYNRTNQQLTNKKDILKNYVKQQNSFEELTGISSNRPEIVMVTDFVPLFSKQQNANNLSNKSYKNSYFTNEGQYVDAKFNIEQLSLLEIQNRLNILSARDSRLTSSTYSKLQNEKNTFNNKIDELRTVTGNITQLLQALNNTKQLFDLHNFVHTTTYDNNTSLFDDKLTNDNDQAYTQSSLLNFVSMQGSNSTSLSYVLSQFGYTKSAIKNNFTSTKIWLQTIYEFKNILENYSYKLFDQNIEIIRQDTNSNRIIKPLSVLNFNTTLANLSVPTINDIIKTIPTSVDTLLKYVMLGFFTITQSSQDVLDKFVVLPWIFSKEYRYSNGLTKTATQQTLLSVFGYEIQTQNASLFDAVFGRFQQSIDDNIVVIDNTIRSLAYEFTNNKSILNFESRPIETSKFNLKSGGEFYIDDLLDNISTSDAMTLNTERIENLIKRLSTCKNGLNILSNNMNWLCESTTDNMTATTQQTERLITSPLDLFTYIHISFVDNQTNKLKYEYTADSLSALFALASSDQKLKSLLFVLCMFQIFNQDFTVDSVTYGLILSNITAYINELRPTLKLTNFNPTKETLFLINVATIVEMLSVNSTSKIWIQTLSIMKSIYATLIENNEVVVLSKTRYSGINDSVMLMMIFDMIVSLFEKYSVVQFGPLSPMVNSSQFNPNTTLTIFNVPPQESKTTDMFTVYDKLNFERLHVVSSFVAIIGTIHALQMKLQTFVNYIKSTQVQTTIKSYASLALPTISEQRMTKLLFNEQQMMLNISTIYDLFARITKNKNRGIGADFNNDNSVDDNDMFLAIDESLITPKLRNYFNLTFSDTTFVHDVGNKNILTIGIPCGFVENLKQKFINNSITKIKQTDIIKINVYKSDVQQPDLIFKPLTFLFELSRFPVRNESLLLDLPMTSNIQDVVKSLPTRDVLQNSKVTNDVISYGKLSSNISSLTKSINSEYSSQLAFDSQEYMFLTSDEKNELLINHTLSYMLELYIKALTDLNVGDYKFVINATNYDIQTKKELAQELVRQMLQDVLTQQTNINNSIVGKLFIKQSLISKTSKTIVKNLQFNKISQLIDSLSIKQINQIIQELVKINKIVNSTTSLSNADSVISSILAPKQFDRVFNVIVDSNDFEIDLAQMKRTVSSSMLRDLLKTGEIIRTATPVNKFQTTILQKQKNVNIQNKMFYKQKARNKNNGDIIFEKYYVTIDTFGEDII